MLWPSIRDIKTQACTEQIKPDNLKKIDCTSPKVFRVHNKQGSPLTGDKCSWRIPRVLVQFQYSPGAFLSLFIGRANLFALSHSYQTLGGIRSCLFRIVNPRILSRTSTHGSEYFGLPFYRHGS